MGAYLPVTDMWSLPIVHKYDKPTNVLANFKYYNRYVATVYCPRYLNMPINFGTICSNFILVAVCCVCTINGNYDSTSDFHSQQ